jgi:hypothetical protein
VSRVAGTPADAGRPSVASGLIRRLGASGRELACLGGIVLLAAALRLVNLPLRGGWDADQGTEMLALRSAVATGHIPTFGPEAISVTSSFHHGALYYDLLLPAAWLGNGDPTWVVAEIALLGLLVIPIVWWIARCIGGPAAGLAAAALAATSASLISYSTFIWNPTLVEPGASIAFLGAWQAVRTRRPAWWVVSAVGAAVAVQAHIAAAVIVLPLGAAFVLDLRRGPRTRVFRIGAWGAAGLALFALSYLPLIVYEFGHDFADTRGMLAYFADPNSTSSAGPLVRLLLASIRILAWPLTRWPIVDLEGAFLEAFATAVAIAFGLIWLLTIPDKAGEEPGAAAGATDSERELGALKPERTAAIERFGVRLVGAWLLLTTVALGLGLHGVSEIQKLPTEQYHVVADPLVFMAAGLIAGGLWRSRSRRWPTVAGRALAIAALGASLAWNAGHLPPLTSPDGGWPAAQEAAARVERDAAGSSISLVPMFEAKGGDAYLYPLTRDGYSVVAPDGAGTVALLCDTVWLTGCGGAAETSWLAANPAGSGLTRIDQFPAAPDRILTVYKRTP